MKKEDLLKLKEKIENLSEEELKKRDEYLKNLSLGVIQGPPTGYSSIDKPYLKYYKDTPIKEIDENETFYNLVFDQDDMSSIALGYLGVDWTYEKLKRETDKCASSFVKSGVKEGDVVLVGVSNSPEAVVLCLALNKIGAVSKWFDIRANANDIVKYANSSNCKCMVAFDMILPKVEKAIDQTNLEKVLVMSPASPLPKYKQMLFSLKQRKEGTYNKMPKDKRFVKFSKFVKEGNENDDIKVSSFNPDKPAIMIQSSGTTGKPKTIVHSDYSVSHYAHILPYFDIPVGKGKTALDGLPPWIAYGLCCTIIYPLCIGTKVELSPDFEADVLQRYIGSYSIAFVAPFHVRYLGDNFDKLPLEKKQAFAKTVDCITSGGDKFGISEHKKYEEVLGIPILVGYGNNEGLGAETISPFSHNKYGAVGIPKYKEDVIIYDNDKKCELPYGMDGEVCFDTGSMFLEYEGNKEETLNVKQVHDDGKVYLHTGDIGTLDKDGFLSLKGRMRRVIIRGGFKISAYEIEDKIMENPLVKECVAVSVPDDVDEHAPMAFVVLNEGVKEEKDTALELIKDKCYENLKEYEVPRHIKIVDSLPYTDNNKYDFVALENIGKEYVESLNRETAKINTKN